MKVVPIKEVKRNDLQIGCLISYLTCRSENYEFMSKYVDGWTVLKFEKYQGKIAWFSVYYQGEGIAISGINTKLCPFPKDDTSLIMVKIDGSGKSIPAEIEKGNRANKIQDKPGKANKNDGNYILIDTK